MPNAETIQVQVLKPFKDAGSGQSYKKGQRPEIEEGAAANYEAAGLVSTPDADDGKKAASK